MCEHMPVVWSDPGSCACGLTVPPARRQTYWKDNKVQLPLPSLFEIRQRVQTSLLSLRKDIKRNLNPTPYKVPGLHSLGLFTFAICSDAQT